MRLQLLALERLHAFRKKNVLPLPSWFPRSCVLAPRNVFSRSRKSAICEIPSDQGDTLRRKMRQKAGLRWVGTQGPLDRRTAPGIGSSGRVFRPLPTSKRIGLGKAQRLETLARRQRRATADPGCAGRRGKARLALRNLAADGFSVAGATSTGEGIRAFEVRRPSLVVDVAPEGGSVWVAVGALRQVIQMSTESLQGCTQGGPRPNRNAMGLPPTPSAYRRHRRPALTAPEAAQRPVTTSRTALPLAVVRA